MKIRPRFLHPGEPAPWFVCRSPVNPKYHFDTVAGRYVVLCFFGSAGQAPGAVVWNDLRAAAARFDLENFVLFGVSQDSADETAERVGDIMPGVRVFWDHDHSVSAQFGVGPLPSSAGGAPEWRGVSYVLDERLRVVAALPMPPDGTGHVAQLLEILDRLPPLAPPVVAATQAPVLVVPRVFEPGLCEKLIALYERHGGGESGFMRDVGGKTVGLVDHSHKRRRDYDIVDEEVKRACMTRIHDRLAPEIQKAFQFKVTRMERYIVACYDGTEGGHFRAHRDNTTLGTAHRRFAVSLHLNTGHYEGGLLRFPEFGRQLYSAPAGGAVVFSCSLLHEAAPVTKGRRYMFLPFLYDEDAARVRQENHKFLGGAAPASA